MKFFDWLKIFAIILLLVIGFYRFKNQLQAASGTQIMMDTWVEIKITTKHRRPKLLLENAFNMFLEYDKKFSYYSQDSSLYSINNSGNTPQKIDKDFYEILKLAQKLYYESNHVYDVSIGALIDIWDFSKEMVPDDYEIDDAMQHIGFDKVSYDESLLILSDQVKLNFGSLCKGFIVDRVMDYLISNQVTEASINAGGDLKFFSDHKRKWKIGIQHPRVENSTILTLNIPDFAVATSGDYERFFIFDGTRYHNILNPHTGYPAVENVSVTIISESAIVADALSTAAFAMNPFNAIELIKNFPNTEGIIYFYDEHNELTRIYTENVRKWM